MLLRLEGVGRSVGSRVLFSDVALAVYAGDRIGIVGPNGAGKTSLLHIAAGRRAARHGPRQQRARRARGHAAPGDRSAGGAPACARRWPRCSAISTSSSARWRSSRPRWRAAGAKARRCRRSSPTATTARVRRSSSAAASRARRGSSACSMAWASPSPRAPGRLSSFSGGWLMRVELAKLLLSAPDVLLLDEPTNHLDLPSIQWFEETLEEFRGAALIVSHDRTFLRRHATRVAELENARFTVFEGGYDRFVLQKEERRVQLEAEARSQDRQIAHTERFIERFRYKASKSRQVQSRVKALAKLERVELAPESKRSMRLRIPPPVRAGEVVLRLEGVHKRYGENVVYQGIEFLLRRGERVALAGPERRRQVDAAAHRRGHAGVRCGHAHARPQRDGRLLRATPARDARGFAQRARGARERGVPSRTFRGCAAIWARSCSRATTSRRRSRCSRAARRRGSRSRRCCCGRQISWCSTSRPTIWTWPPARCSRRRSPTTRERCCSSRTTAPSSTRSRRA